MLPGKPDPPRATGLHDPFLEPSAAREGHSSGSGDFRGEPYWQ